MRRLHLWIGWLAFVAFLATGQYMRYFHTRPVAELEQGLRMLIRSRHIYLLFAALLNLLIALPSGSARGPKWLTFLGSLLLAAAPVTLLAAFVVETTVFRSPTPLSIYGIQAALGGSLCYLIGSWFADPSRI